MSFFFRILAQLCAADPNQDVSKVVAKALPRARAIDEALRVAIARERALLQEGTRTKAGPGEPRAPHAVITRETVDEDREAHTAPHRGRKFPHGKPPESVSGGELELERMPPPPMLPAAAVDEDLEDTEPPPAPAGDEDGAHHDEDLVDELPEPEPEPTPPPRARRAPPAKKKKKTKR